MCRHSDHIPAVRQSMPITKHRDEHNTINIVLVMLDIFRTELAEIPLARTSCGMDPVREVLSISSSDKLVSCSLYK
jgi:hypothetical protein